MTLPPPQPTVSLIIPVYNGGEKFGRCLASVKALNPPPEEVIVVADGDTDGSRELAAAHGARVLPRPAPGGPAAARNQGAAAAAGDILFFVDADVTVPPDAVGRVAERLAMDPGLDALIGSYDDAPLEANFLSQFKNLMHHHIHQTSRREASTFWGACGAIRRGAFWRVGGFDERYRRPSIEDIDLGYRLKNAGCRILLLKELQVKHLKRWGPRSLLTADILQRALPWTDLILREKRLVDDLNLRLSSRASAAAACLLAASLAAAPLSAWMAVAALFPAGLLLLLNRELYRFFRQRRGLAFALKAVAWHWLYYLYSALAFSIGLARHRVRRARG